MGAPAQEILFNEKRLHRGLSGWFIMPMRIVGTVVGSAIILELRTSSTVMRFRYFYFIAPENERLMEIFIFAFGLLG